MGPPGGHSGNYGVTEVAAGGCVPVLVIDGDSSDNPRPCIYVTNRVSLHAAHGVAGVPDADRALSRDRPGGAGGRFCLPGWGPVYQQGLRVGAGPLRASGSSSVTSPGHEFPGEKRDKPGQTRPLC